VLWRTDLCVCRRWSLRSRQQRISNVVVVTLNWMQKVLTCLNLFCCLYSVRNEGLSCLSALIIPKILRHFFINLCS
jgi:hypothetical protein